MKVAKLRLEFAPNARRHPVAGWLLRAGAVAVLVAALVPFGFAVSAREHALHALAELDARQSDEAKPRPSTAKPDPAYLARVKSAQQVAKSLTAPWAGLLDAIESAPQQSVALLAVEPSSAKQSFRLTAEARDAKAMLAYLEALQSDRRLVNVALVSHQVQVQAPGRPIRFLLQAGWGPAQP
jgi:Tfp pilus assembly protein PilN